MVLATWDWPSVLHRLPPTPDLWVKDLVFKIVLWEVLGPLEQYLETNCATSTSLSFSSFPTPATGENGWRPPLGAPAI